MADNVGITPGSGATAASDDIGGVQFQRIKLVHGADGVNDGDVSSANGLPVKGVGELVEAIEAMRMAVQSLVSTIGMALPNAQGFPIMEVRQATAANMNVTATVSGTVTSNIGTGSLANQTQMGGFAANDQIPALMHLQADSLRRNITVT
jgi:hypothetical protein